MALAYTSTAALPCGRANASSLLVPFGKAQQGRAALLQFSSSSPSSTLVRAQQADATSSVQRFDVSSNCVQPVFRSTFNTPQTLPTDDKIKIMFLSESNVCRSVYAEAMLDSLIKEKGLQDVIECTSKGTREYNVGEKPDANVLEVAEDYGLNIKDHSARLFNCANDVVEYDLLLVMDKFTASDALKEVTIYEAVQKDRDYSWKVRRLGEFCLERKIEDIDDPLYGNVGGKEEVEELHRIALDIHDSCGGLINFLSEIHSNLQESDSFKQALAQSMGHMAPTDWVKPPMLQKT